MSLLDIDRVMGVKVVLLVVPGRVCESLCAALLLALLVALGVLDGRDLFVEGSPSLQASLCFQGQISRGIRAAPEQLERRTCCSSSPARKMRLSFESILSSWNSTVKLEHLRWM